MNLPDIVFIINKMVNVSELDEEELPHYKVIIVGKSKAGKTKLLTRYKFGVYADQGFTTVGVDNHVVVRKRAKFTYFDTAGQDAYRAIVSSFYRGSDACIIVYDVSQMSSFDEIAYYYNTVKELEPNALIYIVGCKSDLDCKVPASKIKENYKGTHHEITSSKTNTNVTEVFRSLEEELTDKMPKSLKTPTRKTLVKPDGKKKSEKSCCTNSKA